jgi:hypothetical protein
VRDLAVLFSHLLTTVARLAGPGGARSVVRESVLAKHQLLILNRSRKRWETGRVPAVLQRASYACGAGREASGAEPRPNRRSGESPRVSVAAALSWAVSHAEGRVTAPSIAARHQQRSTNSPLTRYTRPECQPSFACCRQPYDGVPAGAADRHSMELQTLSVQPG